MGRSSNSFTGAMLVRTLQTIDDDRVTLFLKKIFGLQYFVELVWTRVKVLRILDMSRPANITHKNHYHYDRDQARHFFKEGGPHFRLICELAGRNPDYVQQQN